MIITQNELIKKALSYKFNIYKFFEINLTFYINSSSYNHIPKIYIQERKKKRKRERKREGGSSMYKLKFFKTFFD